MEEHRASQQPHVASTLLPTTVVGSYSVPEWLERLKTDCYQRKISDQYLKEIHEVAIKAALKDQETAGVDIVSDGELRRDNDIDYFLARIPGIEIPQLAKTFYYDYYEASVTQPLPVDTASSLGLAQDFLFTRAYTDHPVKFSFTSPYALSRRVRIRDDAYADRGELVEAIATLLNREARALAEAGAQLLQIDEPFLAGYPQDVDLAMKAVNIVTKDVDATWALHVCYGNRYARPLWEGHYDFLFPAVLEANVDQLVLEFARKGYDDLELLRRYQWDRHVGLGVIDVKTEDVESADLVASHIRRALEFVPAEKLIVNPDCGLRHLQAATARAKLRSMVAAASSVRSELEGVPGSTLPEEVGPSGPEAAPGQTPASPPREDAVLP